MSTGMLNTEQLRDSVHITQWFKNSHRTLVHTETINFHLGSDRAPQNAPAPCHAGLTHWMVCFFASATKSFYTSRTRTSCQQASQKWGKN